MIIRIVSNLYLIITINWSDNIKIINAKNYPLLDLIILVQSQTIEFKNMVGIELIRLVIRWLQIEKSIILEQPEKTIFEMST